MNRTTAETRRSVPRAMSVAAARKGVRFDRAYYQRYYFDPRTAVASRSETRARARFIAAFAVHAGLPVRRSRILEAGCGTGVLRAELLGLLPHVHYVALESSDYLCQRYGWRKGRIEEYRSRTPFDLVICYDVLQYLSASAAQRALANFGRLCRGALYFTALTRHDYQHNCDQARTDVAVHLRTAEWYRTRLRRQFSEAGLGFWVRRGAPLTLWELESR